MLEVKSPVEFHAADHTYTLPNGKLVPGVTQIVSNLEKGFMGPWYAKEMAKFLSDKQSVIKECSPKEFGELLDIAKGAAKRKSKGALDSGTLAHDWIEGYLAGQIPRLPDNIEAKLAITAFKDWEARRKPEWLASELVVGSAKHEYGGKLDALAKLDGKLALVDFKTSGQVSADYFLQTAGYDLALREAGVEPDTRVILRIPKDGAPAEEYLIPTPLDLDTDTFLALRQAQRWQSYIKNPDNGILDQQGKVAIKEPKQ